MSSQPNIYNQDASGSSSSTVIVPISVLAPWSSVLSVGNNSGAYNPTIDSTQTIIYNGGIKIGSGGVAPNALNDPSNIVIGQSSGSANLNAIVLGKSSIPSGDDAIIIGNTAGATNRGIAIGFQSSALQSAVAIGYQADARDFSTSIGITAGSATNSVNVGANAATTGANTVTIGAFSNSHNCTDSVAIGYQAASAAGAINSVAIGSGVSLGAVCSNAIAIGKAATITSASDSIAIGAAATIASGSGGSIAQGLSTSVGTNSLFGTTIGNNSQIGNNSDYCTVLGASSTVGDVSDYSTVIGAQASCGAGNLENVQVGTSTAILGGSNYNVALGSRTGVLANGIKNTAVGYRALVNGSAQKNVCIGSNTDIGATVNQSVVIGADSSSVGSGSVVIGANQAGGSANSVIVGSSLVCDPNQRNYIFGYNNVTTSDLGSHDNVLIGSNCYTTPGTSVSYNNVALGNGAIIEQNVNDRIYFSLIAASNGSGVGLPAQFNSITGRLYPLISASRFKKNVEDLPNPERILNLRAVQYNMKEGYCTCPKYEEGNVCCGDCKKEIGFIAEEVEAAGFSELVIKGKGENGEKEIMGLSYDHLTAPIIAILKKHEARIKELEEKIELMKL